jgi:putative endonuclease
MIHKSDSITETNKTEANVHNAAQADLSRLPLARVAELFAAEYLTNLGWKILERNWHAGRFSETDIIARDENGELVFIEVKSRIRDYNTANAGFIDSGFECLHPRKKLKLIHCAKFYMAHNRLPSEACRLDAIIVYAKWQYKSAKTLEDLTKCMQVHHVRNIFS